MDKYSVISGSGHTIYSGSDIEEATYQRDEFAYEYYEVGARIFQNY